MPLSPHLTERQIAAWRRRTLPPPELLQVDDHLAECPECRLLLAEGEPLGGSLAVWEEVAEEERPPVHRIRMDLGVLTERRTRSPRRALWAAAVLAGVGLAGWLVAGPLLREARQEAEERSLPEELRREVAALRQGGIGRPAVLAGLTVPGAVLRGPSAAPGFAPLVPVGTAVIPARPTFRWSPLAGAESYRVTVFDREFRQVAASGPVSGTEWVPAGPLPRDAVLAWQVTARRGGEELTAPGPQSPEALFRVLPLDRLAELERQVREAGTSPLALGVLYARAGLADDAERELAAAVELNPRSEVARALLAGVRAWRQPSPTSTNPAQ